MRKPIGTNVRFVCDPYNKIHKKLYDRKQLEYLKINYDYHARIAMQKLPVSLMR